MLGSVNITEMQRYLLNGDTEGYMNFIQENLAALAGMTIVGLFVIIAVFTGLILTIILHKKMLFAPKHLLLNLKLIRQFFFDRGGMLMLITRI